MLRRLWTALLVLALLFGAMATERYRRTIPRPNPLGKDLLYLPSAEMLRLLSLGNEGLMSDLVYVWAIQYYSQFEHHEKFLYLEKVFDLITDLDPKYFDAYRMGALIMELEAPSEPEQRRRAVMELFDKGIAAMPDDWRLPETAAWDFYIGFHDVDAAVHYAEIAISRPGAFHRIRRALGVWKDRSKSWSVEDSIAYWEGALADATTGGEALLTKNHLYDVVVVRDRQLFDPLLQAYRQRIGHCPRDWEELVRAGWLRETPLDYAQNPYGIDAETCTLVAHKRIRP